MIEVQRTVGGGGCVSIGGKQISAGIHLAGQRVTLRLDATLIHIITPSGVLARTLPTPLPPGARGRLHGARLAGPAPAPATAALQVTRVVSSQGGMMVAGMKIHLGHVHRGKVVTVVVEDSQFRIPPRGDPAGRPSPHRRQGGHPPQRKRPHQLRDLGSASSITRRRTGKHQPTNHIGPHRGVRLRLTCDTVAPLVVRQGGMLPVHAL